MENAKEQREIILRHNMYKVLQDTDVDCVIVSAYPDKHKLSDRYYRYEIYDINKKRDYNYIFGRGNKILICHNEKEFKKTKKWLNLLGNAWCIGGVTYKYLIKDGEC